MTEVVGIDIGGSGIKGARVDVTSGRLITDRFRVKTPQPSLPEAVADVFAQVVDQAGLTPVVGCTFPAIVQHGIVRSAANVDHSWIGTDGAALFRKRIERPVVLLNDADAAGLAEMRFGAGREESGVVLLLTFGTGIGSALFIDGALVPNTELGHLFMNDGAVAEDEAAARLREENELTWDEWIARVQVYLDHIDRLFSPDLVIFGGGISKNSEQFLPALRTSYRLVPAALRNNAGIVGAALAAYESAAYQSEGIT